jgi:ABC-type transporter Mla subunit MlaD
MTIVQRPDNGHGGEGATKRRWFDFVPGQHKPHYVRWGVVFLALTLLIAYSAYTKSLLFSSGGGGYQVKALFSDAAYLRSNPGASPVRDAGVDIGYVAGIQFDHGDNAALVTMQITNHHVHVRRDATASILERTLLGYNMAIDLNPGSPSSPRLHGTLPLSQTQSFTDVDEILQSLNAPGRQGMRAMLQSFAQGLDTNAAGATIQALTPSMRPLAPALNAFRGSQPGADLPRTIEQVHTLMATAARSEAQLGGLIDSGQVDLGVTAARNADLASMVQTAPAAMSQTRLTMVRLQRTLHVLDPLVRNLEPGASVLAPAATTARSALSTATPVLNDARPLLRDLNPALSSLGRAGSNGAPLLSTLEAALTNARTRVVPWLGVTDPEYKLKNYEAIGPFFSSVDSGTESYGSYGHWIAFQAGGGERSVENSLPCQTFIADPTVTQKIQCQQLVQMFTALLSGQSPGSISLVGASRKASASTRSAAGGGTRAAAGGPSAAGAGSATGSGSAGGSGNTAAGGTAALSGTPGNAPSLGGAVLGAAVGAVHNLLGALTR